ncbi:hypothetical protein CCHR01_02944 [Colletotrichum chrysophilum]|uniref:Uncharacterized protein n=1 Tax=Colletotrichum chrysophilum TaxID=1836956 RepID=A0AAD9AUS9_9PEZI|nr:hypothetical protein CCHR01_02944 [Colletotrichum chrysophilum]
MKVAACLAPHMTLPSHLASLAERDACTTWRRVNSAALQKSEIAASRCVTRRRRRRRPAQGRGDTVTWTEVPAQAPASPARAGPRFLSRPDHSPANDLQPKHREHQAEVGNDPVPKIIVM